MQSTHLGFGSTKMHIMRLSREHVKLPSGARRDRKEFLAAYLRFQVGNLQLLRPYKSTRNLVLMNSGTAVPSVKHSCMEGRHTVSKCQLYSYQILDHTFKIIFLHSGMRSFASLLTCSNNTKKDLVIIHAVWGMHRKDRMPAHLTEGLCA
jgi:hypothetical protein